MGLLDRLEQSIERLLEGTTGSLFRQKLQPVEIGKRLERTMLSQQRISVDAKLVPNAYVVRLNPKDYEQFEGFKGGLAREMESWLAGVASRHRLTLLDRISVTFVEDESTPQRNPQVEATIIDQPRRSPSRQKPRRGGSRRQFPEGDGRQIVPSRPIDGTDVINIPNHWQPARAQGDEVELQVVSGGYTGQVFAVGEGNSTIGRSPDNTISLDAPDVSRRHARLERSGRHVRIYDLNSTNGTRINGESVHISDLQPGDEIRLGSQVLLLSVNGSTGPSKQQERW
jgi:hypothetical protein